MNFDGPQRPDASLSFDSGHSVAHLRDPFAPAASSSSAAPILAQLNHYEIQVDGVERHTYAFPSSPQSHSTARLNPSDTSDNPTQLIDGWSLGIEAVDWLRQSASHLQPRFTTDTAIVSSG